MTLPPDIKVSLDWWRAPGRLAQGVSLEYPTRVVLITDTSLLGWGAHLEEDWAQGTWSAVEVSHSINRLELRAIHLALLHFEPRIRGTHVLF